MRTVVIAAGAAALAALSVPAGAAEFTQTVRSIDEVADGAMPEATAISPTEAVVEFHSAIPLACSIVFGATPDFGRIATDMDMAGGAHSDHHPALTGLEPGTEYFYRVQGAAADGTLYVGEVQSFQTPDAASDAPVDMASLAAGARVAAVSSNYGGASNDGPWGADGAIDGSRTTAWSSSGDGNNAYIEIEFAAEAYVDQIAVWTRTMADGSAQILRFMVTTDGGDVFGPFELPDASTAYRFPIGDTARSLRLDVVDSTGGNVGLVEFAAYGP